MATKSKDYLEQMFPDTVGIDIGSARHSVSVPADRAPKPIQEFSAMTCGLEAIAAWLSACRIRRVAMESTGVYWIPLFELLSERIPSMANFTAWIVSGHEDFWWQNSKQQDCPSSEQSSASVSFGGASSGSN